jgi:hypothetical protein
VKVLVHRFLLAAHGTHLLVDRDTDAGDRVLVEVAGLEEGALRAWHPCERKIENGLANLPG